MQQSPWRAYFGQMHKNPASQMERSRHPIAVALTVISLICIITTALFLRFNRWYYGELVRLPLCFDGAYNLTRRDAILTINEPLAYSLSLAVPPVIVLCVELVYLIITLDVNDKSDDDDDTKPCVTDGLYLFLFRFLHFSVALLLTAAFVSILVDVTKIVFDWPRPYFLSEFPYNCDPAWTANVLNWTLEPEEVTARQGFPSYRVALLSAAAVLLSVHSIRTLGAVRSSGPFQTLIVLASALASVITAASVLKSNENRPADVFVGLLMGVISAAYMTSILPTKLSWSDHSVTATSKTTPTTIEELNSVVQMRQGLSCNMPRSPALPRTTSINQWQSAPSSKQLVPLPGLTTQGGGLMRSN